MSPLAISQVEGTPKLSGITVPLLGQKSSLALFDLTIHLSRLVLLTRSSNILSQGKLTSGALASAYFDFWCAG